MPMRSNFALVTREKTREALRACDRQVDVVREAGVTLVANVIVGGAYSPGTPKDTGAAANSWSVYDAGGQPKPFTKTPPDEIGLAALTAATDRMRQFDPEKTLKMGTNCPYMDELEFRGHSPQAPTGFVRMALAQWKTMLREAARRVKARAVRRDTVSSRLG